MLITAWYTGLTLILLLVLALRVALYRLRHRIGVGVAEDRVLERRVRAHGNLSENAPLALLGLALLELLGAGTLLLHGLGVSFVLGRVLHAWGLSMNAGTSWQRLSGTLLTWTMMGTLALMLLVETTTRLLAR